MPKAGRVADAAEGGHTTSRKFGKRLRMTSLVDQTTGGMGAFAPSRAWEPVVGRVANRLALLGRNGVGPAQANDMGTLQAGERLAQRAAGKHVVETERLERIEQHNVQIASQPAVLEAVVQHDDLASKLANCLLSSRYAIGILHVRHVGKRLLQFERFVIVRLPLAP